MAPADNEAETPDAPPQDAPGERWVMHSMAIAGSTLGYGNIGNDCTRKQCCRKCSIFAKQQLSV